jgi:EamA domain-containing membrane protein RarD
MILLVILIYILIGVLEVFSLIKQNKKKELILYSVIFSWAFILSILLNLSVKIPSPAKPIENFAQMFKDLFK